MEVWKDIKGYEGIYQVSNLGRVKRIGCYTNQSGISWESGRNLKPANNSRGYYFVQLSRNNKVSRKYVHRLVAEAFIPNPENKPTVNHINCDRSDNRSENLEWASYRENNDYSIQVMRSMGKNKRNNKLSRVVEQLDLHGNVLKEYPSYREAERQTGISAIDKVCAGAKYRKTAGGYGWRYKGNQEKV